MIKQFMVAGAFAAAILVTVPSKLMAQTHLEDNDDFVVDHFSGPGDQIYTFVNPGTLGSAEEDDAFSFVCADIYVYSFQDPVACGRCFVSANGSLEVSLNRDLRAFPATGIAPRTGVIKVVYRPFNFTDFCDPRLTNRNTASNGLKTF